MTTPCHRWCTLLWPIPSFEAVHPFLDGNGRVGRLLITLLLVKRSIIPSPLFYLSAYFEATR